jgi:hypothetical protein
MRTMGNKASSHLFLHAGNFFGTWQRIDIPLFLNSEYCVYLDADTVIARPFTMADFGLDLTFGLAMSDESDLNGQPFNAGVTLMNVPLLRETHQAYLDFIWANVIAGGQFDGTNAPSDQGAALIFYEKQLRFLEREFNMKPYWPTSAVQREPFIWHFHGAKPQDYMTYALGNPCPLAYQHICRQVEETPNVCAAFQAFGRAIIKADILDEFCQSSFPLVQENATKCSVMIQKMSKDGEPCHDMKRKVNDLFEGRELMDSSGQIQGWYPDVFSWPASLSWGFVLHCCMTGSLLIYVLHKNWRPRHDPNRILVVGRKHTRPPLKFMAMGRSKLKRGKAPTNNSSSGNTFWIDGDTTQSSTNLFWRE